MSGEGRSDPRDEAKPGWRRVLVKAKDRVAGSRVSLHAAAVAYNVFLAMVPLALALVSAGAFIGQSEAAMSRVRDTLEAIAPAAVTDFVLNLFGEAEQRLGGEQGWAAAVSLLVSFYLGSRAVVALQQAVAETGGIGGVGVRRGWRLRAVAFALTLGGGLAFLVLSVLLVFGGRLVEFLEELTGFGALGTLWAWLRIPLAAAGIYLFLLAFYRWGPPRPVARGWLAALLGTGGAIMASLVFGLYLALAPGLGATFGVLGAVAIALVWLYAGAFAILLGALLVSEPPEEPILGEVAEGRHGEEAEQERAA